MGRITIDGQQRIVSARTRTEARQQLDTLRRAAVDGLPVTAGTLTVADLLAVWAAKALPNRRLSPSRLSSHRWAINILTDEFGSKKVRSLTVDDIEAALHRRATPVPTDRRKGRGRTPGAQLVESVIALERSNRASPNTGRRAITSVDRIGLSVG